MSLSDRDHRAIQTEVCWDKNRPAAPKGCSSGIAPIKYVQPVDSPDGVTVFSLFQALAVYTIISVGWHIVRTGKIYLIISAGKQENTSLLCL